MKSLTPFPGKFPPLRRRPRRGTLARQQAWQTQEATAAIEHLTEAAEQIGTNEQLLKALRYPLPPEGGEAA